MTKKDIAIIGGAFDPIHIGHTQMIKYFIDNYIVDEVWVLPSYNSPHKNAKYMTSFNHRVNMANIAVNNIKNVYVNTFEEEYFNNDTSNSKTYTYEILNALNKKYLNINIYFVVGFDSIKNISEWHRFKELINEYTFYIFDREDDDFQSLEHKKLYLNNLGKKYNISFFYELFPTKIENISSTEIRHMLKEPQKNKDIILKYIDEKVFDYIIENKLYA